MKHVQVPPDGEVLPLDPTTIFFRPADDDPRLPHRSAEFLARSELPNAVAMGSDLAKHPELKPNPHPLLLGTMRVLDGDPAAVRAWVEGFR
jgi:hypothetical protein